MKTKWYDDSIQFPRLIAEIDMAGGFNDSNLIKALEESMDLNYNEIVELVNRACRKFDEIKASL